MGHQSIHGLDIDASEDIPIASSPAADTRQFPLPLTCTLC